MGGQRIPVSDGRLLFQSCAKGGRPRHRDQQLPCPTPSVVVPSLCSADLGPWLCPGPAGLRFFPCRFPSSQGCSPRCSQDTPARVQPCFPWHPPSCQLAVAPKGQRAFCLVELRIQKAHGRVLCKCPAHRSRLPTSSPSSEPTFPCCTGHAGLSGRT